MRKKLYLCEKCLAGLSVRPASNRIYICDECLEYFIEEMDVEEMDVEEMAE